MSAARIVSKESKIDLTESNGGVYYIHAIIDNLETNMLLDTGSKYVVLSKNTFNRIKSIHSMMPIKTISGMNANGSVGSYQVYKVNDLTLGACELHDIEVVYMPKSTRDILGLSVLRSMSPFTVNIDKSLLTVNCG